MIRAWLGGTGVPWAMRGAAAGGARSGSARAGTDEHGAHAHPGRLGDAVDALQLGQRHAVLAGDAVEQLAGLHGVLPLPALLRRWVRARRGAAPWRRRRACGWPAARHSGRGSGRQQQLLARLDAGAVAEAVDLDQRRDRHAVALGDAVERVALLHLDALAAGHARRRAAQRRALDRRAGVALGARGVAGTGRRPVVAGAGDPLAGAGGVGRRRVGPAGVAEARAARRPARHIVVAAVVAGHRLRRRGQRPGLVALVGQAEEGKVEPRYVGAAATDYDGQCNNHPVRDADAGKGVADTLATQHRAHLVLLRFING